MVMIPSICKFSCFFISAIFYMDFGRYVFFDYLFSCIKLLPDSSVIIWYGVLVY